MPQKFAVSRRNGGLAAVLLLGVGLSDSTNAYIVRDNDKANDEATLIFKLPEPAVQDHRDPQDPSKKLYESITSTWSPDSDQVTIQIVPSFASLDLVEAADSTEEEKKHIEEQRKQVFNENLKSIIDHATVGEFWRDIQSEILELIQTLQKESHDTTGLQNQLIEYIKAKVDFDSLTKLNTIERIKSQDADIYLDDLDTMSFLEMASEHQSEVVNHTKTEEEVKQNRKKIVAEFVAEMRNDISNHVILSNTAKKLDDINNEEDRKRRKHASLTTNFRKHWRLDNMIDALTQLSTIQGYEHLKNVIDKVNRHFSKEQDPNAVEVHLDTIRSKFDKNDKNVEQTLDELRKILMPGLPFHKIYDLASAVTVGVESKVNALFRKHQAKEFLNYNESTPSNIIASLEEYRIEEEIKNVFMNTKLEALINRGNVNTYSILFPDKKLNPVLKLAPAGVINEEHGTINSKEFVDRIVNDIWIKKIYSEYRNFRQEKKIKVVKNITDAKTKNDENEKASTKYFDALKINKDEDKTGIELIKSVLGEKSDVKVAEYNQVRNIATDGPRPATDRKFQKEMDEFYRVDRKTNQEKELDNQIQLNKNKNITKNKLTAVQFREYLKPVLDKLNKMTIAEYESINEKVNSAAAIWKFLQNLADRQELAVVIGQINVDDFISRNAFIGHSGATTFAEAWYTSLYNVLLRHMDKLSPSFEPDYKFEFIKDDAETKFTRDVLSKARAEFRSKVDDGTLTKDSFHEKAKEKKLNNVNGLKYCPDVDEIDKMTNNDFIDMVNHYYKYGFGEEMNQIFTEHGLNSKDLKNPPVVAKKCDQQQQNQQQLQQGGGLTTAFLQLGRSGTNNNGSAAVSASTESSDSESTTKTEEKPEDKSTYSFEKLQKAWNNLLESGAKHEFSVAKEIEKIKALQDAQAALVDAKIAARNELMGFQNIQTQPPPPPKNGPNGQPLRAPVAKIDPSTHTVTWDTPLLQFGNREKYHIGDADIELRAKTERVTMQAKLTKITSEVENSVQFDSSKEYYMKVEETISPVYEKSWRHLRVSFTEIYSEQYRGVTVPKYYADMEIIGEDAEKDVRIVNQIGVVDAVKAVKTAEKKLATLRKLFSPMVKEEFSTKKNEMKSVINLMNEKTISDVEMGPLFMFNDMLDSILISVGVFTSSLLPANFENLSKTGQEKALRALKVTNSGQFLRSQITNLMKFVKTEVESRKKQLDMGKGVIEFDSDGKPVAKIDPKTGKVIDDSNATLRKELDDLKNVYGSHSSMTTWGIINLFLGLSGLGLATYSLMSGNSKAARTRRGSGIRSGNHIDSDLDDEMEVTEDEA